MTTRRRSSRARRRGMTLLEILVSIFILVVLSLLIYGAVNSLNRGQKSEASRIERARQGREAMNRMLRDLSGAFLSLHQPQNTSLITRLTAFVGQNSDPHDRVDFAAFAHRRVDRDSHESDQAEVGYFVSKDPDADDKYDLVRREQQPMDVEPKKGGIVNVVAEDIESFNVRYFDPVTGLWTDSWDSTQLTGNLNRLPLEVEITLVLKGVNGGPPYTFQTKGMLPLQQPLSFGIPR
jgi:general secretion pathway protein J